MTFDNQELLKRLLFSYDEENRATDKQIEDAQDTLGRAFPNGYIDWLKFQNGGQFDMRYSYQVPFQGNWRVVLFNLLGVGVDGIDGLVSGLTRHEQLVTSWGFPENSLVFIYNNHGGIAVTYDGNQPSQVISVESQTGTPHITVLASDFEQFLAYFQDYFNKNS